MTPFRLAAALLSAVAVAGCGALEQADPFRATFVSVRIFDDPATGLDAEGFCDIVEGQISWTFFSSVENEINPTLLLAAGPNGTQAFPPQIDASDIDGVPAVVTRPGGCFADLAYIALTKGDWNVIATRTVAGAVVWSTECAITISVDESTTNHPFIGFTANGAGFFDVGTTEGCVFEDIELVDPDGNRPYP
ncbi:hypothetical protein HKCCE2091_19710 [Rhodobacterales bacterium HKCCE2091]|nr:hypothetical protein [Rhodobacterales bacterium HKCCE2091]